MNNTLFDQWSTLAIKVRKNILNMIYQIQSGHPGGSLSMVEIIMTLLGDQGILKKGFNAESNDRDRLILSKGHGVPALYAIMAETGYPITQEELMTLRRQGSRLQGHPDRVRIPLVEASTGSLGQGASIAQGIAMSYKMDQNPHRVYSILGDGEMQEGQIWEVALSAPHHKLSHLTLILDFNKGQIDGPTAEVLNLNPLKEKWEAFGWKVFEVNGHSYQELYNAFSEAKAITDRPQMIIAHTIKGKGVSFMENNNEWHGKAPSQEQLAKALEEIESGIKI